MNKIDISDYSFESFIKKDCLYIDKTQYIWNLVSRPSSYFLSRPRRFGKSMLVSTLEAYFSGKKDLFKGLAIETKTDKWEKYPIIHLSMSEFSSKDVAESEQALCFALDIIAKENGIVLSSQKYRFKMKELIIELAAKYNKNVVILIDEYDKPILDSITASNDVKEKILDFLKQFYQIIKDNISKEHFVFMTGVSKFSRTSLFSEMNHLEDISDDLKYADMLGFTENELRTYFQENIKDAAEKMNMSQEEICAELKDWYDGFKFAYDAECVYNPVSVGNFFNKYEFRNYWYNTGTPTFLMELLKNKPFKLDTISEQWFEYASIDKFDVTDVDPVILALQTGYLTIIEQDVKKDGKRMCRYGFPNREIRESWTQGILASIADIKTYEVTNLVSRFKDNIGNLDAEAFMNNLDQLLKAINNRNRGTLKEGDYRVEMQMLLFLIGVPNEAESPQAIGVPDLAASYSGNTFVFEIKVCRDGEKAEKKLQQAVTQAKEKNYIAKYSLLYKNVKVIAVVFDNNTHLISMWSEA